MEASNNQPPPPSKQQQQLYVANGSAWLLKGPMCFACLISLLFAVLALIAFFLLPIYLSDDGTGHDGAGEVILGGLVISVCYLVSLITGVIGRRRVKRDPDLNGNKFNTLYLKLLTIVNLGNTWFVLFMWVYVLPGELNGGCC